MALFYSVHCSNLRIFDNLWASFFLQSEKLIDLLRLTSLMIRERSFVRCSYATWWTQLKGALHNFS